MLGPRPITIVILRKAQPSDIEYARSVQLANAAIDHLVEQSVPWHLGVLPVGSDSDVLMSGTLSAAEDGTRWVGAADDDPWDKALELLQPVDGFSSVNHALDTLPMMPLRPENDGFVLESGLFVVAAISDDDDDSPGTADEVGDWLNGGSPYEYVDAEFSAIVTMNASDCPEAVQVGERFLDLVGSTGGLEMNLCDALSGERLAGLYTANLALRRFRLEKRAIPESIRLIPHTLGVPSLVLDEDFLYDEDTRIVELVTWYPQVMTPVNVFYVARF